MALAIVVGLKPYFTCYLLFSTRVGKLSIMPASYLQIDFIQNICSSRASIYS